MDMIKVLEEAMGQKAKMEMLPMQAGDVGATSADTTLASSELGYNPRTDISEGIPHFVRWFRERQASSS